MGEGEPEFLFKIVKHHRSALGRQVGEAIRLEKRGASSLNSKGEYNRCRIARLVLEQPEVPEKNADEEQQSERREYTVGEEALLRRRRSWDTKKGGKLGLKEGGKRKVEGATNIRGSNPPKHKKSRKYAPIGANWGNEEQGEGLNIDRVLEEAPNSSQKPKIPPEITKNHQKNLLPPPNPQSIEQHSTPSTAKYPSTPRGKPDHNSIDIESCAGVPPVQLDPSVDQLHEGDLGEVAQGWDSNLTNPPHTPSPSPSPSIVASTGGNQAQKSISSTHYSTKSGEDDNISKKCDIKGKKCIIHNCKANRVKVYKEAWIRSARTGLYYMSKRNVLEWRCDRKTKPNLSDGSGTDATAEV